MNEYFEQDGWNYRTKPAPGQDARKLVTLEQGGMVWVGIRAWNSQGRYWQNGNEPETQANVKAWRELSAPAKGFWLHGELQGIVTQEGK